MNNRGINGFKRQSGAALLVSLIMLLLLTVIGFSAVNITTLDTKISANTRDRAIAFDAAETALNVADALIAPGTDLPTDATDGFISSPLADNWWKSEDGTWWASNAEPIDDYEAGQRSVSYVIQELAEVRTAGAGQRVEDVGLGTLKPRTRYYRVTARGEGPGGAAVHLQGDIARKVYDNAVE